MTAPGWTTTSDLRAQLVRLWDQGRMLRSIAIDQDGAAPDDLFPLRMRLKGPTSAELGTRFEDVRAWVSGLQALRHGRLESKAVNHRQLGGNSIPVAVWFDSIDVVAAMIGKTASVQRFRLLVDQTAARFPTMMPLFARRPHDVLAVADEWPLLLDVVEWLVRHPQPGIYLRQVDIAGVHTKFIELHEHLLGPMLDLVLPESAIDHRVPGHQFVRRYGFRQRPRTIRFRSLDPGRPLHPNDIDLHYSLTAADLGRIPAPERLFITENEINYLAFPPAPGALVAFGAGSGLEHLADVLWIADVPVHYWGDIDTHGLAILDQLRGFVPHAASLMMNHETLHEHELFWGTEEKPTRRDLTRLTVHEQALYDDLRDNRIRANLRLEQERIRFGWVRREVDRAVTQT